MKDQELRGCWTDSILFKLINLRVIIQMYSDITPVSGFCYIADGVHLDHLPLAEFFIFLWILGALIPLY